MQTIWPQLTVLCLMALGMGVNMATHGKPKDGTHSFWWHMFSVALTFWLLYQGGFFNVLLK
jgi:hypothetical protein